MSVSNFAPVAKDFKITQSGIKYYGDGSGRDTYVSDNYGGTIQYKPTRNKIMADYIQNKVSFDQNKSHALSSVMGTPNIVVGKNAFYKVRSRINISGLNDIGRPKFDTLEGESPKRRVNLKANRLSTIPTLPNIHQKKQNARGFRCAQKSYDEGKFEHIMSKHGSYPFFKVHEP